MNTFVILCDNTMATTMNLCAKYCEINYDCANAILHPPHSFIEDDILLRPNSSIINQVIDFRVSTASTPPLNSHLPVVR
jgi:hypothetical protein